METMKTPPGKQPETKPAREEVAVYELRFKSPYPDLGLLGMSGGAGTLRTRESVKITYLPQQQLYRVVETSRDPKVKTRTVFVPREWASFEPIPIE